MLDIIKNPIVMGLIVFILLCVYQYLTNRNVKNNGISFRWPLLLGVLTWFLSAQYSEQGMFGFSTGCYDPALEQSIQGIHNDPLSSEPMMDDLARF
jgi:hypothetical protein